MLYFSLKAGEGADRGGAAPPGGADGAEMDGRAQGFNLRRRPVPEGETGCSEVLDRAGPGRLVRDQ